MHNITRVGIGFDLVVDAIRQMQNNIQESFDALKESERLVRLLMNSTAEAIYGVDTQGNCTFANPACLRLLGYADVYDLLGHNMHKLMHHSHENGSHDPEKNCRVLHATQQQQGTYTDDDLLWRADGSCFPAECWSYPIEKEGEILGAVGGKH